MPVTKKIQRLGGSLGVHFPKAILEQHDLRSGDEVELVDLMGCILIRPTSRKAKAAASRREEFEKLAHEALVAHDASLRALAK